MMNKRAAHRSDEEWHQIILAASASGLSDFEYCRDNSIPSSSFYRALARLRQQACELPGEIRKIRAQAGGCSNRYIGASDRQRGSVQTAKLNNLSVFKYLQAVLFYMPDYVHEPEGMEKLMQRSDQMKKLCAIDTKATIEDKDGNPKISR